MISRRKTFGGLGNRLFQEAYIYSQWRKGEIPDIYVQDEKWFKDYSEEIKSMYRQGLEKVDMVSLHVRRGDYKNNGFYVDVAETDYYEKAIDHFPPETNFLIFCADRQNEDEDISDMEWVKERFKGKQFEFFRGEDEMEDWNMMASCKAHIIANSSFSWWAAYVSGNETVCPKEWFAGNVQRVSLPDEWIKL